MFKLTVSIIANISALITIVLFLYGGSMSLNTGWEIAGLVVLICVILLVSSLEIFNFISNMPFSTDHTNTDKIRDHMHSLLEHGGRVAIISRDLSWAENGKMKKLLIDKSEAGDITLYLEHHTPTSRAMKKKGATVKLYDSLGFSPSTRFTITNRGQNSCQVAIGKRDGDKHYIFKYQAGRDIPHDLALDFENLLSKVADEKP